MVARTADDGRCRVSRAIARAMNIRKTARGASSPAKPALHMPELGRQHVDKAFQHRGLTHCR